jgi:hypothetical protein
MAQWNALGQVRQYVNLSDFHSYLSGLGRPAQHSAVRSAAFLAGPCLPWYKARLVPRPVSGRPGLLGSAGFKRHVASLSGHR